MIGQTLRWILKDKRFLGGVLLIYLVFLLVFFYQERQEPSNGEARSSAINWAAEQSDSIQALQERYQQVLSLEQTDFFSDSFYNELQLLASLKSYFQETSGYETRLDEILEMQEKAAAFSGSGSVSALKAQILIKRYGLMKETECAAGNFLSFEKFFSDEKIYFAIILVLFLLLHFFVISEREKGMEPFLYAAKNGAGRLYGAKLLSVGIVFSGIFCFFMISEFLLLAFLYGTGDWNAFVQSMDGYIDVPYRLTVLQYLIVFSVWRIAGGMMLVAAGLLIASLPLPEVGCGVIMVLACAAEFWIWNGISSTSSIVLLRDMGMVQLLHPGYWIEQLRCYALFRTGGKAVVFYGMAVPAAAYLFYMAVFTAAGWKLWSHGLKKSGARGVNFGSLLRYRKNVFGNEAAFFWGYRMRFLMIAAILVLLATGVLSFAEKENVMLKYEKQYVESLNSMDRESAAVWIAEKKSELDAVSDQITNLSEAYAEGKVEESEYIYIKAQLETQMQLWDLVSGLYAQSEEIAAYYAENGVDIFYEYTSFSDAMYAKSGETTRQMLVIVLCLYTVLGLMTIFPQDIQSGVNFLQITTVNLRKAAVSRIVHMLISIFFLSLLVNVLWIGSLIRQYGGTDFSVPAQSWAVYRQINGSFSLGSVVLLEIFWQSLKWVLVGMTAVWISLFLNKTIWAELGGSIVFVGPWIVVFYGLDYLADQSAYLQLYLYGGQRLLVDWKWDIVLILLAVALTVLIRRGIVRWSKIKCWN